MTMKNVAIIVLALSAMSAAPVRARGCVDGVRVFADVPNEHPFCEEIESMYRDGLTTGCRTEDGPAEVYKGVDPDLVRYFCPGESLTRGVAAMFAEHRDPFAQLDRDGRIMIGDHVRSAERVQTGAYYVQFTRDIQRCSREAWPQDFDGVGVEVDVDPLPGAVDTVLVAVTNHGLPADLKFNVRLHCR